MKSHYFCTTHDDGSVCVHVARAKQGERLAHLVGNDTSSDWLLSRPDVYNDFPDMQWKSSRICTSFGIKVKTCSFTGKSIYGRGSSPDSGVEIYHIPELDFLDDFLNSAVRYGDDFMDTPVLATEVQKRSGTISPLSMIKTNGRVYYTQELVWAADYISTRGLRVLILLYNEDTGRLFYALNDGRVVPNLDSEIVRDALKIVPYAFGVSPSRDDLVKLANLDMNDIIANMVARVPVAEW